MINVVKNWRFRHTFHQFSRYSSSQTFRRSCYVKFNFPRNRCTINMFLPLSVEQLPDIVLLLLEVKPCFMIRPPLVKIYLPACFQELACCVDKSVVQIYFHALRIRAQAWRKRSIVWGFMKLQLYLWKEVSTEIECIATCERSVGCAYLQEWHQG